MSIIINSIKIVAPLLLLVALGAFLNYKKTLSTTTVNEMSALVAKIFLPTTIFINIYHSDIKKDFEIRLFMFLTFIFILAALINNFYIRYFVKDDKKKSVLMQASIRSNCTLFALPLSISIYGDSIAGMASLAAVIITNLNNLYCISVFEHYQRENIKISTLLLNVFKHPLTVGLTLGLITQILKIELPYILLKTVSSISSTTLPLALIIIGASFTFKQNKETIKYMSLAIFYKLVFYPALGLLLAILFNFKNEPLVIIITLLASPVAINSYLTASNYNCDLQLANGTLVYSYVFSTISLPIFISIIIYLNLI